MKSMHVVTALFAAAVCCANGSAKPVLEKVVIVERHGVRPPTKAPVDLAKFSEAPWPEWSVKPGELTSHGAQALAIMGGALHRQYEKYGLLAAGDCPAGVFVWSDSADQRTRASGDALLRGMGCTKPSDHLAADTKDPLFSGIEADICPADPRIAAAAADEKLSAVLAAHNADYLKARAAMQSILTPNGCGKPGQRECLVGEGSDKVVARGSEPRLEGPLATASGLTEDLLLEYAEGKPLAEVGWGRTTGKLDEVLLLHNLYADVMRRTPALAARRASLLAQQVVDLINNRPSPFQGAAPVPANAKFVVFLGHDTNLSNMSGFLDAPWTLPGQPDATAPGTALALELWRADDGSHFVRMRVFYQTLQELRDLVAGETPHSVGLALPLCRDGACPIAVVTEQIEKSVVRDCLKP